VASDQAPDNKAPDNSEGGDGRAGRNDAASGDHPVRDALEDALETASSGAARLATALTRPVSLVRVGRKRRKAPAGQSPASGHVIACHVYHDGRRVPGELNYADAPRLARENHGAFAWLGLFEPTAGELAAVADVYDIHPAAVHDDISGPKRPRLAWHGETLLLSMRSACYVEHPELTEESEVVRTGRVTVFLGTNFVVTVGRGAHSELQNLRAELEARPEMLRHGPAAVLYAACNQVVNDYLAVTTELEGDIDDIEAAVFDRSARPEAEKVYQLEREIVELKHAVVPLAALLRLLTMTKTPLTDAWIRGHLHEVSDHLDQAIERVNHFGELLTSILQATLTQVTIAQNEDMRRISAWVAIAAVPTALVGIFGMNFDYMPGLRNVWGYPAALGLMAAICLLLFRAFRRNKWL
jgi:magnesium transporter